MGGAMSLIGLVHLAEGVFKQAQENQSNGTDSEKTRAQPAVQNADTIDRDEFRHSRQSDGNEAGLFQVKQTSVFTAAATVLLVEGNQRQNQTAQTQTAQTPSNAQSTASLRVNAATANRSATTNTAGNATSKEESQTLLELSDLNVALIALGLSQDEISVVDRVAQLINNFSPAAFRSLVNQLQVLAQQSGQSAPNATPSAGSTSNTASDSAAAPATNETPMTAPDGGFTIQALTIKFAGVNEIVQPKGPGNSASSSSELISAFSLQASEAQIVLENPSTGQTAQVQVPQATTPTATTAFATSKAATA